jgi:hypothetical protein
MWFAPLCRRKTKHRSQPPKNRSRRLQLEQLETRLVPTGTWQPLSNLAPQGVGSMILLSNGSVLTVDGGTAWSVLTPDSSGSYVNGAWSVVASSSVKRTFFGSAVLPDGRVMVLGGEYSSLGNDTNTGEIYDPVANTWTTIPNYPESTFGDGLLEVLPNGNVLAGNCCSRNSYIYSPGTNTWSTTGVSRLNFDSNNEEGWVKLAESGANGFGLGSGNILSYEINGTSPQTGQMYVPSTNTWNSAGTVPVTLSATGSELGPSVLLPDGQVFWIGATNHTALYTPGTNTWEAGPDTPNDANGNVVGGFDAPAAVEVNGKVLYAASPPTITNGQFGTPTTIYEYDPSSNTTVAVPDTNGPDLSGAAFVNRMLVLPSGQVLFTNSGKQIWVYNPDSGPSPSWAPTISNLSSFFGTETLTGTQLNGLSEGASYGDDAQMASNYPIIKLTDNNGTVRYASTFNWSDTGVATGSALVSTQFTMPAGAPSANLLNVIANGIPSANILMVNVNAGDLITLQLNPNNSSQYEVFGDGVDLGDFDIGSFSSVYVQLGGGSETVNIENTLAGVPVAVNEGSGSDTVGISRSGALLDNIQGDVFVNGGTGADTLNVYDQNDPSNDTWTVTGSTITRTRSVPITYNGQSVIVINGGSGDLTYNVLSTEAFFSTSIDAGPGTDTVNVQSTGASSTLTINNLFSTSNHDTVDIGSNAPSLSSTLANIAGTVNVANSSGGGTTLTLDDSGDTTAQTFTVTSGSITGTAFPGAINYNGNNGGHEVTAIHLLGGGGGNTVNVQSTAPGTPVSINTDTLTANTPNNNHVNIGSTASTLGGTLANIAGPVNVSSSSGTTTLTIDDSGDTTGQTFTVTNNSITGTGFTGPINYSQVSTLTLDGGSGINNSYNVQSTAASTTTNLLLQGSNTVRVGSLAPNSGGTLANINGVVDVYGPGSTSLYVDDSGDTTAKTASMYDGKISGLAPADIDWSPTSSSTGGVTDLHVGGGSGGNTFNVYGTSNFYIATYLGTGTGNDTVNVLATTGTLNIDGQNGSDTVTLGSLAPSLGGTLANIAGPVNVSNSSGQTTLVVDDSGDTVSKTATLIDGKLTGLAPAAVYWAPTSTTVGGVNFLDILGGSGGNTFNVLNTSYLDFGTRIQTGTGNDKVNVQATTGVLGVYNNAGNDSVTIGSLAPSLGGTLANINAYVDAGGPGPVALTVDDSGDSTGRTATLTRNASGTNTLSGMSPAPIYYENNVTSLTIDAGSGNDSLTVAGPSTSTHVAYNAGGGSNTLIGPNLNNTWNITSLNAGTLDGNITFSRVQNLTGGTASDTFKFSNGKGVTGNIDGGGGTDTLDYSLYSTGVNVNLPADTATGVGGTVTNVPNVTGSPKNDTIVGIAGSVIRGNGGLDTLSGGPNDTFIMAATQLAGTSVTGTGSGNTLVGANITNTWVVNGVGSGTLNGGITFSGMTNLTGGSGSDKFQFLPGGSVAGTIDGGGGANTLDYSAFGGAIVVNLQTGAATATNGFLHIGNLVGAGTPTDNLIGPNATNTWTLTGAGVGTVGSFHFSAIANLTGGTGTDTYKFTGASPSLAGTITDTSGVNKLDYSGYTGGPISVNLATMAASLVNGGGAGGFIGTLSSLAGSPNTGDTLTAANAYNLWSITGPNAGKVNSFAYTGIENLVGGSNVDVFKFSAAGTEASINGGGAPAGQGDWLDYSGFASAVAVNLVTGSATNINSGLAGSVTNIQNVHGGNALNTLTGDSQGNILIGGSAGGGTITGGTGSSLLIADKGGASVTGGSGSDILIADYTTFDTMTMANELALMSILAEWQSADSYADRFGDINQGSAYVGGSHLNGNNRLAWGTTVKDNGLPDAAATVTAAPSLSALDWFFVDTNDITVNFETGEHVDNT